MNSIYENLQKIGFTENEARVYVALLQHPESTGYEASRDSGVPRAKVYEVLASMERKGMLMVTTRDGRQYYRAVPAEVLLGNRQQEVEKVLASLDVDLRKLEKGEEDEPIVSLQGKEQVLEMVRHMLEKARFRVFICGLPEDLQLLEAELLQCSNKGVKLFVLSYGDVQLQGVDVFQHPISPLLYLRVILNGRWLTAVNDNQEALIAQVYDRRKTRALWTTNPAVVQAAASWIANDLAFHSLHKRLRQMGESFGQEVQAELERIRKDSSSMWQSMWVIDEHEAAELIVPGEIRDGDEIFKKLGILLKDRSFPVTGTIQFHLKGDGGGLWQIVVKNHGVRIVKGQAYKPGLRLEMFTKDFAALLEGRLPFNVFLSPDRIRIEGDLLLAGMLPDIMV